MRSDSLQSSPIAQCQATVSTVLTQVNAHSQFGKVGRPDGVFTVNGGRTQRVHAIQ